MADFKVGDRVCVKGKVIDITTIGAVCAQFVHGRSWYHPKDLEHVYPPPPDPRDAEIAALKARVAELESRQADEDRSVSKEKVQKALEQSHTGLPMILPDSLAVVPDDRTYFRQLVMAALKRLARDVIFDAAVSPGDVCSVASQVFAEVKRREAKGGAS